MKGFTLTEVLVVVIIFSLVIVAVYSAYILSQRGYREGARTAEITQNGRVILERITREIRQAEEMVTGLSETVPTSSVEFEDGHTPAPSDYGKLEWDDPDKEPGSDYYYIRYYIYTPADSNEPKELRRQYIVYCFDDCGEMPDDFPNICDSYHSWDDIKEGAEEVIAHPCILEDRIIGEYVTNLGFWGLSVVNVFLILEKEGKSIELKTKVFGRNL